MTHDALCNGLADGVDLGSVSTTAYSDSDIDIRCRILSALVLNSNILIPSHPMIPLVSSVLSAAHTGSSHIQI